MTEPTPSTASSPLSGPAVNGATTLVGIIGHPVAHSRSPQMHNAAFAALGMNWAYVPFAVDPDRLEGAVHGLRDLNVRGFNVTIPHKQAIVPLLDELSPGARAIGAVNTVVNDNGRLVGHNTDGIGFVRSLHDARRWNPKRSPGALILGAGGSARAVCDELLRVGVAALRITNRTRARAEELVGHLKRVHPHADIKVLDWTPLDHRAAINWAELIINTTSVGMKPGDPSPLDTNGISPGHIVADLIYSPPQTPLLAKCKAANARTINGLGMLLYQGAEAFTLWTGQEAPIDAMKRGLEAD